MTLGILPLARELLKRGTAVILTANTQASLNDVTHDELVGLITQIAQFDPVIREAQLQKRLTLIASGNHAPLIDLSRVSAELVAAVNPYWEILELRTQRTSYGKTTAEWLARLHKHEGHIRERFGDKVYEDYDRYLSTCVKAFDNYWSSDVQMKLQALPV